MEASEYLSTVHAIHSEARRRGLYFQDTQDHTLRGREVTVQGRRLTSFASCSYLGLEHHPKLVAAVKDAVERWGTQFSASRGYLSAPPYAELEEKLGELFGGHCLVTSSTTLGHQVALGVLLTEKDAIVLDHQVHYSVHMAATLARASGARVEVVRHNRLERAEEIVARLAPHHRTVWFACDGVFSMYGDLAPVKLLKRLLAIAPNVRLYVDDAHGMSWAGKHGRGSFLSRMPLSERMVVATSLNKAFSASGGVLIFPTAEERDEVRICGGPMVFSGPLQPPMLGAALASAEVHLSPEIETYQKALRERADHLNRRLREANLPLLCENEAPIFFVRCGLPRTSFRIAERMREEGFFISVSAYPSVPMKRSGLRISLTADHRIEDIDRMVDALAVHFPAVLLEEGVSRSELDDLFHRAIPEEALQSEAYREAPARLDALLARARGADGRSAPAVQVAAVEVDPSTLVVEHHRTVHAIDKDLWDRCLGTVGACSWHAMATLEKVFSNQPRPEHNWDFHYLVIRDQGGRPVLVTFFTVALNKDDMLMRHEVSEAVEKRRKDDPYFLTSMVTSMGSGLSEGNHLYLDRSGPWRAALLKMLEVGQQIHEEVQSNVFMLRDMPAEDPEMDAFMLDQGLVKIPMFPSNHLTIDWTDLDGYLASLSRRQRRHVRRQVEAAPNFEVRIHRPGTLSEDDMAWLHQLYRNVATRKLRLNVFELPQNLIPNLLECPAWEIGTLHLRRAAGGPEDGRAVAFFASHVSDGNYAPFFCGLDYDYVFTHGVYRQMIYRIVLRAMELGMHTVHMGMDADFEKGRFGTHLVPNCIYLQARDHYNAVILKEIVAEVGMQDEAA